MSSVAMLLFKIDTSTREGLSVNRQPRHVFGIGSAPGGSTDGVDKKVVVESPTDLPGPLGRWWGGLDDFQDPRLRSGTPPDRPEVTPLTSAPGAPVGQSGPRVTPAVGTRGPDSWVASLDRRRPAPARKCAVCVGVRVWSSHVRDTASVRCVDTCTRGLTLPVRQAHVFTMHDILFLFWDSGVG